MLGPNAPTGCRGRTMNVVLFAYLAVSHIGASFTVLAPAPPHRALLSLTTGDRT